MEAAFDSCMAFHESVRMSPDSQATRIEALRRLQEFGDACNRTPNVALRPSTVAQLLALLREAASAGTAEFVAAMAATFSNGVMGVPARDPDPVRKHQLAQTPGFLSAVAACLRRWHDKVAIVESCCTTISAIAEVKDYRQPGGIDDLMAILDSPEDFVSLMVAAASRTWPIGGAQAVCFRGMALFSAARQSVALRLAADERLLKAAVDAAAMPFELSEDAKGWRVQQVLLFLSSLFDSEHRDVAGTVMHSANARAAIAVAAGYIKKAKAASSQGGGAAALRFGALGSAALIVGAAAAAPLSVGTSLPRLEAAQALPELAWLLTLDSERARDGAAAALLSLSACGIQNLDTRTSQETLAACASVLQREGAARTHAAAQVMAAVGALLSVDPGAAASFVSIAAASPELLLCIEQQLVSLAEPGALALPETWRCTAGASLLSHLADAASLELLRAITRPPMLAAAGRALHAIAAAVLDGSVGGSNRSRGFVEQFELHAVFGASGLLEALDSITAARGADGAAACDALLATCHGLEAAVEGLMDSRLPRLFEVGRGLTSDDYEAAERLLDRLRERRAAQPKPRACALCGATAGRLDRCGRCRGVYYCSLEHHKSDWPRHKVSCKPAPAQSETTHGEGGTPPGAAASTSDGVGPTEAPLQPGQKSGLAQHLSEAVVARSRQQRREGAPAACAVCSKTSEEVAKLRSCAGCRRVKYCSTECARVDWVERQHGRECRPVQEALASAQRDRAARRGESRGG